jgi:transcriptional regulator with XRE-family HTH domain
MEKINNLNQTIAKNLAYYRKAAGLTQAELAERINYSDKSVSKWESGNGVPDVYILVELAQLFGITVDELLSENAKKPPKENKGKKRMLIILLSCGLAWLVATCVFVILGIVYPTGNEWLSFLYAVPVNAILVIIFTGVWKYRLGNFFSVSTLIWTLITCIYVTVNVCGGKTDGLWGLFIIGAPLQVLEILWVFFRASIFKIKKITQNKKKSKKVEKSL